MRIATPIAAIRAWRERRRTRELVGYELIARIREQYDDGRIETSPTTRTRNTAARPRGAWGPAMVDRRL